MSEFTDLQTVVLVVGGCAFFALLFITLALQITIGIRLHRQEGCLGMVMALNGTLVLLTGWRRADEFNLRPLMIAYSLCVSLLLLSFCGMFAYLGLTGQLE